MVYSKTIREIKFSSYEEVEDKKVAGKWLHYPRKKIEENGRYKLLKLDGKKAFYQHCVNRIKEVFEIKGLDIELVRDLEGGEYGSMIGWVENICTLGEADFWMKDEKALIEVIKILIFDAIVGNNDRMVINILIAKEDFRPLAIDEGESFRFYSGIKIKFRRNIREVVTAYAHSHKDFVYEYIARINCGRVAEIMDDDLYKDFITGDIKKEVLNRLSNLEYITQRLFYE